MDERSVPSPRLVDFRTPLPHRSIANALSLGPPAPRNRRSGSPHHRPHRGGFLIDATLKDLDPGRRATLARLSEHGRDIWAQFDRTVRLHRWHPFVCADYDTVLEALAALHSPGLRFLEWGSATGVITIMADLLGYEAYGIELDESLVSIARDLAAQYDSDASFVVGSFLPTGFTWKPSDGDARLGTVGEGPSGYLQLGLPLEEFNLVYAFPWGGEEALMHDLMRVHGRPDGALCLARPSGAVELFQNGKLGASWPP